jgi:hypothetical protein
MKPVAKLIALQKQTLILYKQGVETRLDGS